jgi:hypothetical protein
MDTPQNHIWGPALWMILHSAAERIGSKHLHRLPQEESRIWIGLLGSLRYSLPCPHCKKHYTTYFSSVPIMAPLTKESLRRWLYELHYQVNQRTEKENHITLEQISEIYGNPFNFTQHYTIVAKQMTQSLRMGWSSRTDLQRTLRFLEELKRFYDFF